MTSCSSPRGRLLLTLTMACGLGAACGGDGEPAQAPDTADVVETAEVVQADAPDAPQSDVADPSDGDAETGPADGTSDGDVAEVGDADGDGGDDAPAPPPEVMGERCDEAIAVPVDALPFYYDGDTTWAANDYSLLGGCQTGGSLGDEGADVAFVFTPEFSAHYVAGLSPATLIGESPTVVYVLSDCASPASTCAGTSSDLSAGGLFSVYMEAETPYYFIVDGLLPGDKGGFTFFFDEGACIPACPGPECGKDGCGGFCGDGCDDALVCDFDGTCVAPTEMEGNVCDTPFVVDALPFAVSRDTWYGSDAMAFGSWQCPGEPLPTGWEANDHVYRLDATVDGHYDIWLSPDFDAGLYVIEDCANTAGSCLGGADSSLADEHLNLWLDAGQTVHVVVDGYGADADVSGRYTLVIAEPCVPDCDGKDCGSDGCVGSCGECVGGEMCSDAGLCVTSPQGDVCGDPIIVDSVPFAHEGDTNDFEPDYGFGDGGCPGLDWGWGAGSSDVVYAFTPTSSDWFALILNAPFDSVLYVVTDCEAIDSTCVAAADESPSGEQLDLYLVAGETVFIIVDGYGNISNPQGPYSFSVTSACEPSCVGKACGSDGCGGECGECEGSLQCDDDGQCVELPGNSCADPFPITGPFPFEGVGDSTDATPELGVPYDACPGDTDVRGAGSREQVWSLVPEVAGVYTFTVQADHVAALYVIHDCGYFGPDCFTPKQTGPVTWFDVSPSCDPEFNASIAETCLGLGLGETFGTSEVAVPMMLDAGVEVFVVVDGNSNNSDEFGPYSLGVEGPCAPQCEGKACGSDGCGLTCGDCDLGLVCTAGQQCEAQAGNACDTAYPIDAADLPFSTSGTTLNATNVVGIPYDHCGPLDDPYDAPPFGNSSADELFLFVPEIEGTYDITLSAQYPAISYVLTDCMGYLSSCFYKETYALDSWLAKYWDLPGCAMPKETCLGRGLLTTEGEVLYKVELEAGVPYWIVVDGTGSLWNAMGFYDLLVEKGCDPQCEDKDCGDDGCGETCGECSDGLTCNPDGLCVDEVDVEGNSCENPFEVTTIPFLATGDTSDNSDIYQPEGCPGVWNSDGVARDEVWHMVPQSTGTYVLTVTGDDGFVPTIYVATDCAEEAFSCLGGADKEATDVALEAGMDYYIIIDGGLDEDGVTADKGSYVLEITEP